MGLPLQSSQPFPASPAPPGDDARNRQLLAQMLMNMRGASVPDPEPPSAMVRIGRGMMDIIEPPKQVYLNVTDRDAAGRFERQRKADEAIYLRGAAPDLPPEVASAAPDFMRALGRTAILAPLAGNGAGVAAWKTLGLLGAQGLEGMATNAVVNLPAIRQYVNSAPDPLAALRQFGSAGFRGLVQPDNP